MLGRPATPWQDPHTDRGAARGVALPARGRAERGPGAAGHRPGRWPSGRGRGRRRAVAWEKRPDVPGPGRFPSPGPCPG